MRSIKKGHKINFLITAGGTREYIDPVRFISNASSGKMGYRLAESAKKRNHNVLLVAAPVNQSIPRGIELLNVTSAGDMFKAVKSNFEKCDCLVMAAAVSDYTPVKKIDNKIKRSDKNLNLKLKPTKDILKWAGNHKRGKKLVIGFALEDKNLKTNAERKMKEKNIDIIIANKPSVIGEEKSTVWIKSKTGNWKAIKNKTKAFIANEIIKLAETLICSRQGYSQE